MALGRTARYKTAMADEYAGDVPPKQAWDILSTDKDAVLVDVRTDAEWLFVGVPDLASVGKEPVKIAWQTYPGMNLNPNFVDAVKQAAPNKDAQILFLCRSGQRSKSAAIAMTQLGYGRCYNIAEGFEGDKDASGHRSTFAGWKFAGLPWKQ
jgi:rhodanese-related sulfurtransferase